VMLLLFQLAPASVVFASAGMREFVSGSYNDIVDARRNRAFILVFWSVDCPPCYGELEQLGSVLTKELKTRLVLVSLDSASDQEMIREVLNKYNLAGVEAWVFSSGDDRRLRHEVDPMWYGELPRSYLFDSQHNRQPISGVLSLEQLKTGLKQEISDYPSEK